MNGTHLVSLSTAALLPLLPLASSRAEDKAPRGGTIISVVNVASVFSQWEKHQALTTEPLALEAARLKKTLEAGTSNDDDKAVLEKSLLELQRKIEDLERQGKRQLAKKQEAGQVDSFKELTDATSSLAKRDGIQVILGFGETSDWELFTFENINRKMQGMDPGGTVPLFLQGAVNRTTAVAELLNRGPRTKQELEHGPTLQIKNPAGARLALINVGMVFHQYEKAKDFKVAMEKSLQPAKDEAARIKMEFEKLAKAYKDETKSPEEKQRIEEAMLACKRQLENIHRDITPKFKKKQEAEGDLLTAPNISRKLQGMDSGATVPLHLHPSADISQAVLDMLNQAYLKKSPKKGES